MKYVLGRDVESARHGSMELFIERLEAIASQKHGSPVTMIATHAGKPSLAVCGDDLLEVTWYHGKNGELDVQVEPSSIVLPVDEFHVDKEIGSVLMEVTRAFMSGETCNRLHDLAMAVEADEAYTPFAVASKIEESVASADWHAMYMHSKDEIRGAIRGLLGRIEDAVKIKRFSTMSDERLAESADDLRASVAFVADALHGVALSCSNLVCNTEQHSLMRESVVNEAASVSELLRKGSVIIEDLRLLARTHDMYVNRLQHMDVVSNYLAFAGAP